MSLATIIKREIAKEEIRETNENREINRKAEESHHIIMLQMTLSSSYKISVRDTDNSILKKKILKGKQNLNMIQRMLKVN